MNCPKLTKVRGCSKVPSIQGTSGINSLTNYKLYINKRTGKISCNPIGYDEET